MLGTSVSFSGAEIPPLPSTAEQNNWCVINGGLLGQPQISHVCSRFTQQIYSEAARSPRGLPELGLEVCAPRGTAQHRGQVMAGVGVGRVGQVGQIVYSSHRSVSEC